MRNLLGGDQKALWGSVVRELLVARLGDGLIEELAPGDLSAIVKASTAVADAVIEEYAKRDTSHP